MESPAHKVSEAIKYDAGSDIISIRGRSLSLKGKRVFICGFGKCAFEMASGAYEALGARIDSGVMLSYEQASVGGNISILKSSHPLPDENTLENSRRLVEFVEGAGEEDLLICLVSGGGSSFFEIPAEGVSLADIVALNSSMVKSAMPISDVNKVRKALSAVKGGRFLRHIKASLITLAASDTAASDPADIASGPTWPCIIDKAAALRILEKYDITPPPGVRAYLEGPSDPGCVKCNLNLNSKNMIYEIVADNASFLNALGGELKKRIGAKVFVSPRFMTGGSNRSGEVENITIVGPAVVCDEKNASDGGRGGESENLSPRGFAAGPADKIKTEAGLFLRSIDNIKKEYSKEFIFIAGGEVPVAVKNRNGRGGRCQHFALEMMKALKELPVGAISEKFAFAAFATDGLEAFTGAAGACFDEKDLAAADLAEIGSFLDENNSFDFFLKNGGLITTGATGLNANDVFVACCGI